MKIHDETRKFLKFLHIRIFLWNVFYQKRRFLRLALSVYYKIHGKYTNKLLLLIYRKRKSTFFIFFVGFLTGLCQPPLYIFIILPFTIAIFIRILDLSTTTQSLVKTSACFYLGYCTVAFFWPAYGAYIFGYSSFVVFLFSIIIIILAALIPTIFSVIFGKIGRNLPPFQRMLLFSSCFILAEYFRSFEIFQFPFGLVGYSLGLHPALFQSASVFGVLGLSFFTIVWASSFYFTLFTENKIQFISYFRLMVTINVLYFGTFLLGFSRIKSTQFTQNKALIIQGNTSVKDSYRDNYFKYVKLTEQSQKKTNSSANIVIWPEGAPFPFEINQTNISQQFTSFIANNQTFIFNSIQEDTKQNTFNTMYITENNTIKFHNKHYLVPYGEYIPIIQKYKFGKAIARGAGIGFSSGKYPESIPTKYDTILPLICYEIAYSGKIYPKHKLFKKFHKPSYIVNITNDEWFGKTSGPYQHFLMAQFRAVEEGLPVIRSSNNGFSAVIDIYGQVASKKTKLFTEDYIYAKIPISSKNRTIFSIFGNKPLYYFCMIILQYYVFINYYTKNWENIHRSFTARLEARDRKKLNADYKRRW